MSTQPTTLKSLMEKSQSSIRKVTGLETQSQTSRNVEKVKYWIRLANRYGNVAQKLEIWVCL
ncbi:hypothetical protein K2173_027340 [Erythroxylum novogranatense]|uniref:Uncharacterized protein n=1 Tax=Erythroxylum novogranatense TaxID=1862640 RepID=A0AAV8U1C4_9ROSI|nr:hypothetical protein K2173_027340 [Erythroxylum novogranatense]